MRLTPEINKVYNHYTTIDGSTIRSKNGVLMFHVKCDCGKEEYKAARNLISGRCKSCKSCASKRTAKSFPPPINSKGTKFISMTHFSSIKHGALRRGINFDLDIQYVSNLFESQDGKCALTNMPITLEPKIKGCNVDWSIITASLDRINNDEGYIVGNVWWVHKEANRLKNNYPMSELLNWCKLILSVHGNPEPSSVNDIEVTEKVQRLTGEESTDNPDTSVQPLIKGEDIV